VKTYNSITTGDLSSFFRWKLDQKHGKDGRKLRGTRLSSSLTTYWKLFLLVYERATTRSTDSRIVCRMHQVLRDVAKDYELNHSPQEKPLMDVEDVREVYRRL